MTDHDTLRSLLGDVRRGHLDRRAFVNAMLGLGLTVPLAYEMLASAGMALAQPPQPGPTAGPAARRSGGGALKTLWWQAPTILNPHLSVGLKDADGARLFYEPLVAFDADGHVVPVLASEVPTVENGGVARDGLAVTCRLKPNVTWHDGRPFSAEDVVFTWEYAADPTTSATTIGGYERVERVEAIADHVVKIVFKRPTPFWAAIASGSVLPGHVFKPYRGPRSGEAPENRRPVGTGPYRIVRFRPGDELRAEMNPHYHVPGEPFFDALEMKGGGDAVSAARAVLQTGEYDFASNMQVEHDVLARLERGGKGKVAMTYGGTVEHILCNQSDPWAEVDGERASARSVHPFLTDPAVRQALSLVIDRASIAEQIYGRTGKATGNVVSAPARFVSSLAATEFSVEKASRVLDDAGWKRGADGIRVKGGRRLKIMFQTSINAARQKTQAIVKQAATRAGIEMELKAIAASTYFSSDPANPDTTAHFHADLQMFATFMGAPDPEGLMRAYTSAQIASRANKWQRRNVSRWRNEEYDRLFEAAESEMDPVKRAARFIRMNDLLVKNVVVIPLVWRASVSAVSHRLKHVHLSGWESELWRVGAWRA